MKVGGEIVGFVLAGGKSTRMGRDKALLAVHGTTLIEHVALAVKSAIGNVTVIGHASLEFPVLDDEIPDRGPLGGLYTALGRASEWALIAAVDMPNVTSELLTGLAKAASQSTADAVVCETGRGLHPLCAVYRSSLREAAHAAILQNRLKMHDFLATIRVEHWPVADAHLLANLNTPEELSAWETAWETA